MTTTEDGRHRPQRTMANDSEWRHIVERARAAGMSVSRFLTGRALGRGARDGAAG